MNTIPDKIVFEETGIFYPMVTSIMFAIAGLESVLRNDNPMKFEEGQVITLEGKVHKELRISPIQLHQLSVSKKIDFSYLISILCNILINTAYESVKDLADKTELFEFFRHVRNASSHENLFYFRENEPKMPAQWRGKQIDCTVKGKSNPLFGVRCFNNFLGIADSILLLWDVEQALKSKNP